MRGRSFLFAALVGLALAAKKKAADDDFELLELVDDTLEASLAENPLMLVSIGVPNCGPCNAVNKKLKQVRGLSDRHHHAAPGRRPGASLARRRAGSSG